MKVLEILNEAPRSSDIIDQEISAIRDEITKIHSKARARGQSSRAYANQLQRLQAMLKSRKEEKRISGETQGAAEQNRAFWKQQRERQLNPELTKQRFKQATSEGQHQIRQLLDQYGSWSGIADEAVDFVNDTTENGKYALDVQQLADHFGLTPRTIYRWLERPQFRKLRYLMPSQRI